MLGIEIEEGKNSRIWNKKKDKICNVLQLINRLIDRRTVGERVSHDVRKIPLQNSTTIGHSWPCSDKQSDKQGIRNLSPFARAQLQFAPRRLN